MVTFYLPHVNRVLTTRGILRRMIRRQFLTLIVAASLIAPAASASEPKKKGGGESHTQFNTINVFTEASRRRHGTLSVDMGLYSDDAKLVEQIRLYQPRLQDAYVARLQAYAGSLNSSALVNADFIVMQLQTATDAILGRKGAKVLLGTVLLNWRSSGAGLLATARAGCALAKACGLGEFTRVSPVILHLRGSAKPAIVLRYSLENIPY